MSADNKQTSANNGEKMTIQSENGFELESNWEERCDSFDNMGLKEDLLRGIYGYGFERPSMIQQKAIVPLIK
jgi:translation initiation factor 4A